MIYGKVRIDKVPGEQKLEVWAEPLDTIDREEDPNGEYEPCPFGMMWFTYPSELITEKEAAEILVKSRIEAIEKEIELLKKEKIDTWKAYKEYLNK